MKALAVRIRPFVILFLVFCAGCSIWRAFVGLSAVDAAKRDNFFKNATRYYESGKYDAAEQQLRKALQLDSGHYGSRLALGWTLFLQRKNLDTNKEALSILGEFVDDYPDDFKGFLGLGLCFLDGALMATRQKTQFEKDLEGALDENRLEMEKKIKRAQADEIRFLHESVTNLKKVLELNLNNTRALAGLGEAYTYLKQYPQAVEMYSSFIEQAISSRKAFKNLNSEEAQGKIVGNVKYEFEVRRALANIYFKQRAYQKSVEQIDALLLLAEEEKVIPQPEDFLKRGQCFFLLGTFDKAEKDLNAFLRTRVVEKDPQFDRAVNKAYELLRKCREKKKDS